MINLDNPKFVVWGFTHKNYCTHTHIHEAFYRALWTTYDVEWLDQSSDTSGIDFANTIFITEHNAAKQHMPIREDCFYVVHGLNDDVELRDKLPIERRLSWNVYHDFSHGNPERWDGKPIETVESYEQFMRGARPDSAGSLERVFLAEDTPFYPAERRLDFRWATDLLPWEIESMPPCEFPNNSRVINYVGTKWFVNQNELEKFGTACNKSGIRFNRTGAGQDRVVSIEENIRLVRDSYFAPALVGSHHLTEGYAPCRIFKNISYGMMGVTNSQKVNDIFHGLLIYNPDPYELFFEAVTQLPYCEERTAELMKYVTAHHTYLNRLESIMKAVGYVLEMK